MLILTRKSGETIMINDSIRVTVLQVRGGQVKIGVEAPANVAVHRSEIYERIKGGMKKTIAARKLAPNLMHSEQALDLTRCRMQSLAEQASADSWIYFQHCDPYSTPPHS